MVCSELHEYRKYTEGSNQGEFTLGAALSKS